MSQAHPTSNKQSSFGPTATITPSTSTTSCLNASLITVTAVDMAEVVAVVVNSVGCTYWYLNLLLFTGSLGFAEVNESETNKNMEISWTYLKRISWNQFIIRRNQLPIYEEPDWFNLPNLPNLFETDVGISLHILTYPGLFPQISRWGFSWCTSLVYHFTSSSLHVI